MARKTKSRPKPAAPAAFWRRYRGWIGALGVPAVLVLLFSLTRYESYAPLYDAEYVGAATCGTCHTTTYSEWQLSPHANMTRPASAASVVGDFDDGVFYSPADPPGLPTARMSERDGRYFMALRNGNSSSDYTEFPISYAIGYQYRQEYLTQEADGVLRRLPVQWSTERQEFFTYWNFQEQSTPSPDDMWAQMQVPNSAWNLFCARCHTTSLRIHDKDAAHTRADVEWVDDGIACEACHGPGSQHVNYFKHNYVNRLAAFLNSKLRGEPVAYIALASKLTPGQDLSTCARCHSADIHLGVQDVYRLYEPGYSREGRINDISHIFQQSPMTPGRDTFTVEVYDDGRPKGIGMIFRGFVESQCYALTEQPRCYDCHDPHNNKAEARPGILQPSATSNSYCLACHQDLQPAVAAHTHHADGTPGSFCYDCHMPNDILNFVSGTDGRTRTHLMSSVPRPDLTLVYGPQGSPNACSECHADQSAAWATEWAARWWGGP